MKIKLYFVTLECCLPTRLAQTPSVCSLHATLAAILANTERRFGLSLFLYNGSSSPFRALASGLGLLEDGNKFRNLL
jgi:hypothetical protein